MDNKFLTLLDLAQAKGIDFATGLIDNAAKFCPEVKAIRGRPVPGTDYPYLSLKTRPTGGFRLANDGVETVKSEYDRKTIPLYIFDSQMTVDSMLAKKHPMGLEGFLTQEALNLSEGNFETIGNQTYYGLSASTAGFDGLAKAATDGSMSISAGGSDADKQTSVYAIYNDARGCQFLFGQDGDLDASNEWLYQQVESNSKKFMAYCNGLSFWIGLDPGVKSVSRLANCDATHPVTDEQIAKLIKLHPLKSRPNMLLMNRSGALQLQKSRSATTSRPGQGGQIWMPEPTDSNGIPIVITDSIVDTEAVV